MFRPVVRGISGQRHGHRSLAPGEQWSEIHYIHHNWKNVPSGKAALEVVWPVFEPGREGKEVARPTAKLDINIPVATQARVHALCQRLEERLGNGNSTENERQVVIHEVIDYVQYTTHAELAPIVWRLIESFPNQSPVHDFIPMVYAAGNDKGIVNRRLIKLACDLNYPDLDDIFWYWRRERVTLSTDEMTPLLQSENVWTRAMTGATFTDRCGKEWMEQLFRDLRASQQPLPGEQFARLLSQLDDDDFATRERATRALQEHGEPVRVQLHKALQDKPSIEVKSRIQRVLDEIAKGPPPIARKTLWLLENVYAPQSHAMLKVLAEGPTDSWATKEAKAILAKRQNQKP